MTVASLSSSAIYGPALYNLNQASRDIALSTARLSSGNRLIRIGDDVAAFSIATRLQSQLAGLRQASSNAAQANSFLQVANGALTAIGDILDQMQAVAIQADSASLTTVERATLQEQFSQLSDEIDRLANNTKFNHITLLNGDVSGQAQATTTTSVAEQATGELTFSAISAGNKVILNGVTLVANTNFTVGGDLHTTIDSLVTALNNSTNTALSQATYVRSGNALQITHDAGGALGRQYTIDQANSTATFTTAGDSTVTANIYTLSGGEDDGLYLRSTLATGTIGDTLVNAQSQTHSSVTLTITGTVANNEKLRIDDGAASYLDFTFKTSASASNEIQIGDTTEETIQNAIDKLSQYTGSDDYGLRQLSFTRDGDQLIITGKNVGALTDMGGNALAVASTVTNATLSAAAFSNGTNTGVNTSGVTNGDFVGTISGFTATYNSADNVTASITVGNSTYTATITDTTPGVNTVTRFSSASGGYFDVQLASAGATVAADTASAYAARLNSAFSTLTFYQERMMSNFTATGDLADASVKFQLDDFTNVKIDSINVTAPSLTGGDATIDIVINGETFRNTSGIGGSLGAYEGIKLTSLTDGNRFIQFTNGSVANSFSSTDDASDFAANLRESFGMNADGAGVDFQVGESPTDVINVVINDVRTATLFNGTTPAVTTEDLASDAQDTIENARDRVSSIIATVGALQSRFITAGDVLGNSILNIDAARSQLADTDIAEESTRFALDQLKLNSAIAVIAQTRQLQSSLLQTIQFHQ